MQNCVKCERFDDLETENHRLRTLLNTERSKVRSDNSHLVIRDLENENKIVSSKLYECEATLRKVQEELRVKPRVEIREVIKTEAPVVNSVNT